MSHEIRTPMNGVLGMTATGARNRPHAEQRECVETIRSSGGVAAERDRRHPRLLENRGRQARAGAACRSGSATAVEDSTRTLIVRAREKNLKLTSRVPAEVPEHLVGDLGRLRQVLLNLVGNALKFTDRGEVSVEVALEETRTDACRLRFSVRDTGIGIPENKHKLIFDAFAQGDGSTHRKYGGTGLGLAISAKLVALMGGRIWLESAPGAGSTFHFTAEFRLGEAENAAAPHGASENAADRRPAEARHPARRGQRGQSKGSPAHAREARAHRRGGGQRERDHRSAGAAAVRSCPHGRADARHGRL